jgi:RNA-directed DNA polymerase
MNKMQMHMQFGELSNGRFDNTAKEFIATRLSESPTGEDRLMEMICERENMLKAYKRVESNKGAPGVDGMRTTQLHGYMRRHWDKIRASLLEGKHKPFPVRRAEIPKENGRTRLLGIPTVIDRMIQQAMAQVLSELWEHTFSEYSYAFRPKRSQQMAIQQAKCYVEDGYTYVVDIDLAKFFDRVNHDRLMFRLAKKIKDKRVLKLIRGYLNSGVMIGDVLEETEEGTPQGGPLSPLLSNFVLDELDKELEKRGLRFVRYADDAAIYVKSQKEAEHVKRSITKFIHRKLKLVVNEEKSEVNRPWHSKYLGFRITRFMGQTRIGIHDKSLKRFRDRVREITARKRGRSQAQVVKELNEFLHGWAGYFKPGFSKTLTSELDHWIRRRLRAYVWKQWPQPRTRVRNLKARGVLHKWAMMVGNTRKGEWRLSKNGTLCAALPDTYFTQSLGLILLGQFCP